MSRAGASDAGGAPGSGGGAGIDLATFAAVQAAVADGFPEEEVLAHHHLEAAAWSRARAAWTQRLVEEGQGGALFGQYKAALHRREDELGREVAPIDRDLDAWLGFVAAMAAEEPASLLGRTGLRLPDLSRLSRAWERQLAGDADLRRQAEEKRAAGPVARVPELRLGTSRLAPEGAPAELERGPGTSTAVDSFEEVSIAEYVAVVARLERPENLLRSVLRTKHIDERTWTRERARIEAAMAADPVLRREVAVLMSFERSRLDVARSERSPSVPPPAAIAMPALSPMPTPGPMPALAPMPTPGPMPRAEAYAFEPAPASSPFPRAEAYAAEVVDFGIVDEGTSMADEATAFELPFAVGAPALPFAAEPAPPPSVRPVEAPAATPAIALEDHARLHVELNAGYEEGEVYARYGLDRPTRLALDAQIDELKRRDPRSAAAWLEAYQAHAAWLLAVDGADA